MKKIYKAPLTEVVKLNVGELLQMGSQQVGVGDPVPGGQGGGTGVLGKDDEDYDSDLW